MTEAERATLWRRESASLLDEIIEVVQDVEQHNDFLSADRAEPKFVRLLRDQFLASSYHAEHEVSYADNPRKKCDLLVEGAHGRLFLEVKLLFPAYWRKGIRYQQRLFEPLKLVGRYRESHSAAQDLRKLATLKLPNADFLGLLIVASGTPQFHCSDDFAEFSRLANLEFPWRASFRRTTNTFCPTYLVETALWICPARDIGTWWHQVRGEFDSSHEPKELPRTGTLT